MIIWICNKCRAEVPGKKEPESCPLCGQKAKGFVQGERADPSEEDKKFTQIYEEVIEELKKRDEGCEPTTLEYCFEE